MTSLVPGPKKCLLDNSINNKFETFHAKKILLHPVKTESQPTKKIITFSEEKKKTQKIIILLDLMTKFI